MKLGRTLPLALAACGAALFVCLLWRPLLWQGLVPVDGNMMTLSFPNWHLMRTVWEAPRLPLWNPWRSLGEPHLADPVCMALYPPMVLLSAGRDFAAFLRLWVVLHTALAALFMGLLAKRLYGSLPASLTAAVVAACNGFFMARVTFPDHFAAAAWLPAVLYFLEAGSSLALGAVLALQWLAGFPPFFLVSLAASAAWALWRGRESRRVFAAGCLWALGLSSVQWLPFLEMMAHSARDFFLSPQVAVQYSVPPAQLLKELGLPLWSFFKPEVSGDPAIVTFYVGIAALALTLWAVRRGGRREAWLGAAAAAACLLSLGSHLPGYQAFPPLRVFRFPANWLLPAAAALAILAAAGVSLLKTEKARWLAAGAVALELLLFAQPARVAWAKPEFLTDVPALTRRVPSDGGPRRIFHTQRLFSTWRQGMLDTEMDYLLMRVFLAPSFGTAFGVQEVASYQTLAPRLSVEYARRLAADHLLSPLLDWAGAAVIVDLKVGATKVERGAFAVLDNRGARARVFPVDEAAARVTLREYSPGRVRAGVEASRPTLVVFSETDYPGWRVSLDGKPVAHERFEGIFPAVTIPEGRHEVMFRFVSPAFWVGLLISLGTLLGMGWLRLRGR